MNAHRGVMFDYLGEPRQLWFSIEKTNDERAVAKKVAAMVRALVSHLTDVAHIGPVIAKRNIDADYVKGILAFREEAPILTTDAATLLVVKGPRPLAMRLIQRDHESGDYAVLDTGRNRPEFHDFLWVDLMVEANKESQTWSTKW